MTDIIASANTSVPACTVTSRAMATTVTTTTDMTAWAITPATLHASSIGMFTPPLAGSGGRSGPATDPAAQHHLIGSKGIAMHTGRFERTAPATFFLAACVGFFGACAAAIPAPHAQGTNRPLSAPPPLLDRVPSMPPPIFNPSSPYTVPQTRETPVSPASPGSIFGTSPSPGVN